MEIKKELIKRDIAGDTILVPIGKTVYDASGLFVLNELGTFIWDRLPDAKTEDDILHAVLDEYEVTEQQAKSDISEFMDKLRSMEII